MPVTYRSDAFGQEGPHHRRISRFPHHKDIRKCYVDNPIFGTTAPLAAVAPCKGFAEGNEHRPRLRLTLKMDFENTLDVLHQVIY